MSDISPETKQLGLELVRKIQPIITTGPPNSRNPRGKRLYEIYEVFAVYAGKTGHDPQKVRVNPVSGVSRMIAATLLALLPEQDIRELLSSHDKLYVRVAEVIKLHENAVGFPSQEHLAKSGNAYSHVPFIVTPKLKGFPSLEERMQKHEGGRKGLSTGGKTRRNRRRFKKSRKSTRQKRA